MDCVAEINGAVFGVVVDVRDPLQQRRLRIRLPSIGPESESWARVASGFGAHWTGPGVGDQVVVVFEHGDLRRPVVIGGLWNGEDEPSATGPRSIQLPTGPVLRPIGAVGQSGPCGSAASLLQQTAPLLASMECTLRLLRLTKPLIDIISALPAPRPAAVQEFQRAAVDLSPCLLAATAASAAPFVRDLLCVIVRILECIRDAAMGPVAQSDSIASIQAILDSAASFFTIAGLQPVQLAAASNIHDLLNDIARVQAAADALGGCAGGR